MKKLPSATPINGAILYHGPSTLDGENIVVILTGIKRKSNNGKTGHMLQTWIMRADREPHHATRDGSDTTVCGDCVHAGNSCYVQVERAPLKVYRTWKNDRYHDWRKAFPAKALRGKRVRFGAYGDPSAVPFKVWRRVFAQGLAGWTGYTHQWKRPEFLRLRNYMMASVDSHEEASAAWAMGWRTFRVAPKDTIPVKGSEVSCPASEEAGKRTDCAHCNLCSGQALSAKSITIQTHGYRAKNFAG